MDSSNRLAEFNERVVTELHNLQLDPIELLEVLRTLSIDPALVVPTGLSADPRSPTRTDSRISTAPSRITRK